MNARPDGSPGIALVAVLIALSLLLALVVPFTASMSFGSDAAMATADTRTADLSSQSARALLLGQAAMGHPAVDTTPGHDTAAEYGDRVDLPKEFGPLQGGGRVRLGGEVEDLQRRIHLEAVTPMLLGNLLGTTCRLQADLLPDSEQVTLDDAGHLPEQGLVWIDHEVVAYSGRNGNALTGLARSQQLERGFILAKDHEVKEGALVLDYRCVVAASWPIDQLEGLPRNGRKPFETLRALNEQQLRGLAGFTLAELDVFERTLSAHGGREQAPVWGRAERVFDPVPVNTRRLRVKTALHLGPGSTVRLREVRDVHGSAAEYNMVMGSGRDRGQSDVQLPTWVFLDLLLPVGRDWPGVDTVIEPLLPPPVNINTASAEVLTALCWHVRRAQDVREHADGRQSSTPQPPITLAEARAFADAVVEQRDQAESPVTGPFRGCEDLARRLFKPRLDESQDSRAKDRWIRLYRNLQTGRDGEVDMGTAPVCFSSGPWVSYRAAASVSRTALATGVGARSERQGVAAAVPGFPLHASWLTQAALEEAFRLDQRSAFWHTLPVNTSAVDPQRSGIDPVGRFYPHLVAMAFPTAGLGQPRFPSTDPADSGFQLAPSTMTSPLRRWDNEERAHDWFSTSIDPRGRDTGREGVYLARNSGPSERGGQGSPPDGDHSRLRFPFSVDGGVAGRFGISFWVEPQSMGEQTFFDYGTGDREHNRISVEVRGNELMVEMLDEAGVDPEPGRKTRSSPDRTAIQWRVPVAELALPAGAPLHLNAAVFAGRPTDMSLLVDGVPRGKPKHVTWLTATIPVYDPSQQTFTPGATQRPTDIDVMVESTEGFPEQGILRIGLELFEYTARGPGVFQCRWRDSMGGRMARMRAEEYIPSIPVDGQGRPTVDINSLRQQGVNLAVAPEHRAGSLVELYGFAALAWPNSNFSVGDTRLTSPVGQWAFARVFLQNPTPITMAGTGTSAGPTIGRGLDVGTVADLELSDPYTDPNDPNPSMPPANARQAIVDAFPTSGGIALLVQPAIGFQQTLGPGQGTGPITNVGGIEVIKYGSRQGNKLTGIQRAYPLPGDNTAIDPWRFDGTARKFITDWDFATPQGGRSVSWDAMLNMCLFVVPISLGVQNVAALADPSASNVCEWAQLYPDGNENDTEWVRYDQIAERNHIVRGNRSAWRQLHNQTSERVYQTIQVGRTGPLTPPLPGLPHGPVTATSGYIGYIPQLESDLPIVHDARRALDFRGDPFTGTSSHPQPSSIVLPVQRTELKWGNYGALSGRLGRNDRITLIAGSTAGGSSRPAIEWHTVNWQCRRFEIDIAPQGQNVTDPMGNEPFQLVACKWRAAVLIQGRSGNAQPGFDSRLLDRVVKYPSGELPAAYVAEVPVGGAAGGRAMQGILDEVSVTAQLALDLTLDEAMDETATTFTARPDLTQIPNGWLVPGGDLSARFPQGGGLVSIDGELIGFQARDQGVFRVATNGRGLLGTMPRAHDRGARVQFLTHVPAAILGSAVQPRSDILPIQALGALPLRGTVYMGRELLHYCWVRRSGDQYSLEMPRYLPPGEDPAEGGTMRGLFRGRYGTIPQGAGQGEVVFGWPFRPWDRYTEGADDPEVATFQLTHVQSPVHWQTVRWTQETTDSHVEVLALARVDNHGSFADPPERVPGMFRLQQQTGDDRPLKLDFMGSQLETRFFTVYRNGAFAPDSWNQHGWKTAPKIKNVVVEYEGQGQILRERITVR